MPKKTTNIQEVCGMKFKRAYLKISVVTEYKENILKALGLSWLWQKKDQETEINIDINTVDELINFTNNLEKLKEITL